MSKIRYFVHLDLGRLLKDLGNLFETKTFAFLIVVRLLSRWTFLKAAENEEERSWLRWYTKGSGSLSDAPKK